LAINQQTTSSDLPPKGSCIHVLEAVGSSAAGFLADQRRSPPTTYGGYTCSKTNEVADRQKRALAAASVIAQDAIQGIATGVNALLADVFALYLKTKNFHWHMSGPHFRDYHLLLDDHADQFFAVTDELAERA